MGLSHKLKNCTVYVDGVNHLGEVAEVELPTLKKKLESFRHGGMIAELDADMGLEKMEATVKYGGLTRSLFRQLGKFGVAGSMIRFVGAYQEDLTGGVVSSEAVMIGMLTEIPGMTAKVGDNTEHTGKMTLSFLKWSVAGREVVLIDVIAGIMRFDGVDQNAAIRAALQM